MSKDALWFKHDADARHDPKIRALCRMHGPAGYGIWWAAVEMMRASSDYRLRFKAYTFQAIADDVYGDPTSVERVLNDCINELDLFVLADDGFFSSPSLARRMDEYDRVREQRSAAGKASARARKSGPETPHFNDNATGVERDANNRSTRPQLGEGGEGGDVVERSEGGEGAGAPLPPVVASLLLGDGTYYDLTREVLAKYAKNYPDVDAEFEAAKMAGWCDSAPKGKRKTLRGIEAFVHNWLKSAAEDLRNRPRTNGAAPAYKRQDEVPA